MSELEYISSALFLLGFGNLFLSLRKGRLLTSIFQFAVIVLIFGQCLWLAKQFELYNSLQLPIGYNEVFLTDAIFVGYLFVFFQLGLSALTFKLDPFKTKRHSQNHCYKTNILAENLVLLVVAAAIPLAMIIKAGGMNFFYNPGSMLAGQTLLLFLAGILKWGVLSRIIFRMPQTFITRGCFVLYLLVALFTSRFMTIFALFQLMIFLHYFSSPLKLKGLINYGIFTFLIIIVFGIYRDIGSNNDISGTDWSDMFAQMIDFSGFFFDWFYTLNAEIFVGVCNAAYEIRSHQTLDYLVSELNFLTLFFPNSIKTDTGFLIYQFSTFISENSAVSSSVIASGFERYYFGVGAFGFVLYSSILLGVLWLFETRLSRGRYSKSAVISIQVVNGIRGSLLGVISFFGIADLIAFYVFRLMIKRDRTR